MTHKSYDLIGEQVFSAQLENGLTIYVIPKQGYNKKYAFFATNYGGADRRFKYHGEWLDTPAGIAHFLEHKMFDTPDGNALTLLSANGALPNAFTSPFITAYHFECTDLFEENLETLLSFVSVPYFTPESVEKEQGIIGQEIRMTEDNPHYAVYYGLLKSLYATNPVRDTVAGTVESIAEITADTLNSCHKVFYNPSNMVLCVAGDVDPDEIMKTAARILPKEAGEIPVRDYGSDGTAPSATVTEAVMEVGMPLFMFGCKLSPASDPAARMKTELVGELALALLLGHSSPLFLRLYKEGLLNNSFGSELEMAAGAAYFAAGGESRDPKKVLEELRAETGRVSANGFEAVRFDIMKKALLGRHIRSFNSFESICYGKASSHFGGFDSFEIPAALAAVTEEDVLGFIRTELTGDRMAISIVRPGNEVR